MKGVFYLVSMLSILVVSPGTAEEKPENILPEDQWNSEVELWLARAMVSEADWSAVDHAAIAWTLKRQWEERIARNPSWTFLDQVRAYCAGLRGEVRSPRSRWVRDLGTDGAAPASWPSSTRWEAYQPLWDRVLQRARAWNEGSVEDPCKGESVHWGGPMDRPARHLQPVNCGRTFNIFYRRRR